MVDIQSATAGKKEKKETTAAKYNGLPNYGRPAVSFYLFSSPNLSGRRLHVYHTSTHGVALLMAALRSRCGHYIFALWFLLLSSSSFLA